MVPSTSAPAAHLRHPLVAAKMSVPQVRAPVIVRPRLLEQISRGVHGPLTVVSAAAGAGKTLLLATWIAQEKPPGPVAWLTLDAFNDDSGIFWAYVIATLRRHDVVLPDDIGEPIRGDDVDRSFLARLAVALAGQPQPVILVLDEFECVSRREILHELAFVLRNAEPALRLVILTRNAALSALHRYRLTGDIVQVGTADLAFTEEEAQRLLRQHGVRLSAASLASLTEQTGGWAAGLRLSAVAMQRRADPDSFVTVLPTAATALTEYLLDEVLDSQAPPVREFLLRTSVVDRLCPDLADVLTGRGDGDAVLATLQTANVLTSALDDAPGWYRYHPLFARVLRAELHRRHRELVPTLHRQACAWLDRAGFLTEAVSQATEADDWPLAATTVVRQLAVGKILTGRESTTLCQLFDAMPDDEAGTMPAVIRAACSLTRFDLTACADHLDAADRHLDDEPAPDRARARASLEVVRTVACRAVSDAAGAETAGARALAELDGMPELAARRPELRALVLSSLATMRLWVGRFDEAEEALRAGRAVAREPGCEYPRMNLLERAAWLEYRWGHLRRAAQLAEEAVQLAETSGLPVRHRGGAGHLTLALVALEWNDRAGLRVHLDNAEKSAGARLDGVVATAAPLLRVWQYARVRDFRRAFTVLDRLADDTARRPLPPWLATRITVTRATVHLLRSEVATAATILDRVDERGPVWSVTRAAVAVTAGDRAGAVDLLTATLSERATEHFTATVDGWLLMARVRLEEGQAVAARTALTRALELARVEGHRRPFVDAGPWLRPVLHAHPDVLAGHEWLGPPLTHGRAPTGGAATREPAQCVEPLTERERTVLTRMAQAMSIEDIAADLFLSVNTIKTHQRSIYRKLSVSRRNDAVRRARELRLT